MSYIKILCFFVLLVLCKSFSLRKLDAVKKLCLPLVSSLVFLSGCRLSIIESRAADYDSFSAKYDILNGERTESPANAFGINHIRDIAATFVSGNVLELAVGTGLQLPHYQWNQISSFIGVDESTGMLSQTSKRLDTLSIKIPTNVQKMDATTLSFPNNDFDSVVDTFSFCVFSDPQRVMDEAARVVKPNGRVILLENSRSDNVVVAAYQDITEPILTPISKGCKWNIDIDKLAINSGLHRVSSMRFDLGTILLSVYERNNIN